MNTRQLLKLGVPERCVKEAITAVQNLVAAAAARGERPDVKRLIKADDSLDVFGVHALGGILGALLTGVFNSPALGGPGLVTDWVTVSMGYPGIGAQLLIQAKAVGLVIAWTAVVALAAFWIVKLLIGLRVTEEVEREGLDTNEHGERAYT